MRISEALKDVTHLGIDTAPFIYFVEANPTYFDRVSAIFQQMGSGAFKGSTSVITLTEVLHKPLKNNDQSIVQVYRRMLHRSSQLSLAPITSEIAEHAAALRAQYKLRTPDALQIATALAQQCQGYLTNDFGLRRVNELSILILDELERDLPPDI